MVACKSENGNEPIKRINVDLKKVRVENIEDIIVESDTIRLETIPASLIKSIARMSFVDNKILIWDVPDKLLVFSEAGAFLNNIGNKGQSGDEFLGINDYMIVNDTAFIYDFNNRKIMKFEINGKLIGSTSIKQSINRICPLPDNGGYIALNTFSNRKDNPKFSWLDCDFEVRSSSPEQLEHSSVFSNTFFQNGSYLDYWEMFNNVIFAVTKDAVTPKYIIDFMAYDMPNDIAGDIPKSIEYYTKNSSTTAGIINNVIETDEIIAFMFAHDKTSHWAVVNKKNSDVRVFKLVKVEEPFGKINYVSTYHDGWFYSIYMPEESNIDDNYYLIRFKISSI